MSKSSKIAIAAIVAAVTTAIVLPGSGIYTFWHEIGHCVFGFYAGNFTVDWATGRGHVDVHMGGALSMAAGSFFPAWLAVALVWLAPYPIKGYSLCLLVGSWRCIAFANPQYGYYAGDWQTAGALPIAVLFTMAATIAWLIMAGLVLVDRAPKLPKPHVVGNRLEWRTANAKQTRRA